MKEVPLSNCQDVVLVDDSDYETVTQWKWYKDYQGYACRMTPLQDGKRQRLLMHRMLLGASRGVFVDHANHNTLDNRRENIRLATPGQNQMNRRPNKVRRTKIQSRFKGIAWNPILSKWHATIRYLGRRISLGYHQTEELAAKAYNDGARKYFGSFAYLNPLEGETN